MRKAKGFTLVELMIAIALMVILTGSVVFVFTQAQKIYSDTDAAVKVYQNARIALDTMERDIANAYKTVDMEFWGPDKKDDLNQQYNGHLDQNTEDRKKMENVLWDNVPAKMKELKLYRMIDTGTIPYVFSMLIKEETKKDKFGTPHWNDSIYFKTETAISSMGNSNRTALVRFGLSHDPNNKRPPILMKWVTWLNKADDDPKNWRVIAESPQPLCYFVTDFRVEIYMRNKRSQNGEVYPGKYYTVSEARDAGFETPVQDQKYFMPLFMSAEGQNDASHLIGKLAGYKNTGKALFERVLAGEPYLSISGLDQKKFLYQLGKGDTLFLYNSGTEGNNFLVPHGEYTIKDIRKEDPTKTNSPWQIYFRESIDTSQMDKAKVGQTKIAYRGAWLPASIRISMKVIDENAGGPEMLSRTIVRVFKILGS